VTVSGGSRGSTSWPYVDDVRVRHTEFWSRLEAALGTAYYRVWAEQFVMAELDRRTAQEALDAGLPPKQVWAAVWKALELPPSER
jgi:hypothetical protein